MRLGDHRLEEDRRALVVPDDHGAVEDDLTLELVGRGGVHPHRGDAQPHQHAEPGNLEVGQGVPGGQGLGLHGIGAVNRLARGHPDAVEMEIEVRSQVRARGMAVRLPVEGEVIHAGGGGDLGGHPQDGVGHGGKGHFHVPGCIGDDSHGHRHAVLGELSVGGRGPGAELRAEDFGTLALHGEHFGLGTAAAGAQHEGQGESDAGRTRVANEHERSPWAGGEGGEGSVTVANRQPPFP